jgi:hypothetical protein
MEEEMAIGTLTRLPEGRGAEQYDAVNQQMGLQGNPPDGLLFHSAGELDGRFQIFNLWETREQSERFTRERIRPALVAVMGEEQVASLPEPEMVEVAIHNYLIP